MPAPIAIQLGTKSLFRRGLSRRDDDRSDWARPRRGGRDAACRGGGPVSGGVPPRPNRRAAVAAALARLAPRAPDFEAAAALDRALASPGLRKAAPETAARLALVAYARHVLTDYDDLLAEGYDRDSARHFVLDELNAVLAAWGAAPIPEGEAEVDSEADDDPDGDPR